MPGRLMPGRLMPGRLTPGRLAAAGALAAGTVLVGAVGLAATSVPAGAVTSATAVITVPGTDTPIHGGASTTPFSVVIPASAACPGDTEHDGYHVFTYLVPKGVSPTSVSFRTGQPSRYLGFFSYGSYVGAINTAVSSGQVVSLPPSFSWTRLPADELFAGGARSATWEGGIACADIHGAVTTTWNAEFVFTASTSDPHGFTWRVVQSATVPGRSTLSVGVILIILAVVFGVIAVVLSLRSRSARGAGGPSSPSGPGDAPPGPAPSGVEGRGPEHDPVDRSPHQTPTPAGR
jgi:hypothetical protein